MGWINQKILLEKQHFPILGTLYIDVMWKDKHWSLKGKKKKIHPLEDMARWKL